MLQLMMEGGSLELTEFSINRDDEVLDMLAMYEVLVLVLVLVVVIVVEV